MKTALLIIILSLSACNPIVAEYDDAGNTESDSDKNNMGGGQNSFLHLPLPKGAQCLLTQGANGEFSHSASSTKWDLDFDTSNSQSEEIYASVSGIAHVHDALLTSSPFGNHINTDRGDGTYGVDAHLGQVFICDGCEVAIGQLIAFEGCTGVCTGDHVHTGLHKGDASLPAEKGVSIKATYLVENDDGTTSTLSSEDFVVGKSYRSALPVALKHPDGTLVITGYNPKVYLIENGHCNWILNEQVFWSQGYRFEDVVLISDEELNCYPEGEMISQIGLVEAVTDPNGSLWLIVGAQSDPKRYRIQVNPFGWQGVLASWGLLYTVSNPPLWVMWDHSYLTQWNQVSGFAQFRSGSLMKEMSSSAVYVAGDEVAMPIKNWETFLLLGFLKRPIIWVEDGAILSVQQKVGDCQTGKDCVDIETMSVCENGWSDASDKGNQGGSQPLQNPQPAQSPQPEPESQPVSEPQPEPAQETQSEPESPPTSAPPAPATAGTDSFCPDQALACISDVDMNGIPETLLLADHLWTSQMLDGVPAYVYSNGGCFAGPLTTNDLVRSTGAYYILDFSPIGVDCSSQITLVSTIGMDGYPPQSDMSNWMWWQNAALCSLSNSLCQLMNNGTSWEEWLISVAWHPQNGLMPNGNGLVSNFQL